MMLLAQKVRVNTPWRHTVRILLLDALCSLYFQVVEEAATAATKAKGSYGGGGIGEEL